jgi:hypothetical protein
MLSYQDYEEFPSALKIRFDAPNLDLREVSLVGAQIHRLVNKVAEDSLELPHKFPYLYVRSGPWAGVMFGKPYDPLFISLQITNLSYGSFSAETRVRVHRVARDLSIGVVGSLVASVIWSLADSAPKSVLVEKPKATAEEQTPSSQHKTVDVGPNIVQIAKGMTSTGKPWELTSSSIRVARHQMANPSIERTLYGLRPSSASHVKR